MGKTKVYPPIEKYKNYSLPTSKPLKSHAFYKEKVWTLQEQMYKKLKKVAELLERLYPKLTDDFSKNIKVVIEKNLEILIKDLDLMQQELLKKPSSFNTNKLKINQHRITEMKNVCDTLQTVRSYEYEVKNLAKIKHALHELERLIQPTSFEKSLEKAGVKNKQKAVSAVSAKKIKKVSIVKSKKPKAISKKAKPAAKLPKQVKIKRAKKTAKKVTKSKPKLPAKKILKTKRTSKKKSSAEHKKKFSY